jgi:hypothetical protein
MSRSIIIALPTEKCRDLAADLGKAEGVVSVAALQGASLKPPGDVLMVSATNGGMQNVLELLNRHQIGEEASIETTEPRSLVSPTDERQLEDEGNDGSWAEMSALLRRYERHAELHHHDVFRRTRGGVRAVDRHASHRDRSDGSRTRLRAPRPGSIRPSGQLTSGLAAGFALDPSGLRCACPRCSGGVAAVRCRASATGRSDDTSVGSVLVHHFAHCSHTGACRRRRWSCNHLGAALGADRGRHDHPGSDPEHGDRGPVARCVRPGARGASPAALDCRCDRSCERQRSGFLHQTASDP